MWLSFYAGAIYVCTEDAFPSRRLKQMIDVLHRTRPYLVNSVLMDNVYIEHSADVVIAYCLKFPNCTTCQKVLYTIAAQVSSFKELLK